MKKRHVNKVALGLVVPLATMLFVGCSSKPRYQSNYQSAAICSFPDGSKGPAPEWVCNPSKVTGGMTAMGSSKSASPFLQNQACLADARLSMSQTLEVSVKGMTQLYAESTGSGDRETLDQMSKAVTEQLTQATLHGTSAKRYITSPKGTYYCLVAMEVDKYQAIAEAAEKAMKTSMGNQEALWQKFQAKMSIEEMTKKLKEQEQGNEGKTPGT